MDNCNGKQVLKVYNFHVPDSWYSNTELWVFDLSESLGAIGRCIYEHEEYCLSSDMLNSGRDLLCKTAWEDLPTDIINDCRQQIVDFNRAAKQEIGKLTLLDNGEIGKLQSVMFRFKTDDERLIKGKDAVVYAADELLLTADIVVDMGDGSAYYIDNAYGIRMIDEAAAIMASYEMSRLSREIKQFIHREETKIVSIDEWKKKKLTENNP